MTFSRLAPLTASNVRLMMCSRAWVSTCTVTSSGIISCSINVRMKSNSVWEAAGKPTSISLKPTLTSSLKNSSFSSRLIGMMSDWLPSRRSTLHHTGALSTYSFFVHSMHGSGGMKYCLLYFSNPFM